MFDELGTYKEQRFHAESVSSLTCSQLHVMLCYVIWLFVKRPSYMWSAKVSSLSRVTPKSRTLDEKVKSGKVEAISLWSSLRSCCRVPNQIMLLAIPRRNSSTGVVACLPTIVLNLSLFGLVLSTSLLMCSLQ